MWRCLPGSGALGSGGADGVQSSRGSVTEKSVGGVLETLTEMWAERLGSLFMTNEEQESK